LRKKVEKTSFKFDNKNINVTISIGITSIQNPRKEIDKGCLIAVADKALYNSKKNGRNRTTFIPIS
jgi:diguanylate cyclase (GGDEF)-like protein